MSNKYFRVILSLLAVTPLAMMLGGCSKAFDNKYTYSETDMFDQAGTELLAEGFASGLCVAEADTDVNTSNVDAAAFGLFSVDDKQVIAQHNIYNKMYPASTTKILTCLIALEKGDLDDIVTVPEESQITVSGSSMANLKTGDQLTLRDLLYGLMVPSGNDAAVAIACHIAGDTESFVKLMNEKAAELGATHSHFMNPNGLPDDEHYTTVYDMYLIFNEAIKNEEFTRIACTSEYSCTVRNPSDTEEPERTVSWKCGNAFLSGKFPFADNMQILCGKTGHTNAAGFCLVLGETDNAGKRYISIVMNAPQYETLYSSMRQLAAKGLVG